MQIHVRTLVKAALITASAGTLLGAQQRDTMQMQQHMAQMQDMMRQMTSISQRSHSLSQQIGQQVSPMPEGPMRAHQQAMQQVVDHLGAMADQMKGLMEQMQGGMKDHAMMGQHAMPQHDMEAMHKNMV